MLRLRPARDDPRFAVGKLLVLGSLAIVVLHAVALLGRKIIRPENGVLPELFALLDAGDERTLAAWWTGGLLFAAALAAALVARLAAGSTQRRWEAVAWWVIAGIVALLSLDEIVSLHERGAKLTGAIMAADSPLRKFGWLLPAAALIVLFGAVLIPVFRALPSRPRAAIIAGFATSIAGAAGMEAAYVILLDAEARQRWLYLVMVIEEAAEMAGVLLILAGISMAVQVVRASGGMTLRYPLMGPAGGGTTGSRGRRHRGVNRSGGLTQSSPRAAGPPRSAICSVGRTVSPREAAAVLHRRQHDEWRKCIWIAQGLSTHGLVRRRAGEDLLHRDLALLPLRVRGPSSMATNRSGTWCGESCLRSACRSCGSTLGNSAPGASTRKHSSCPSGFVAPEVSITSESTTSGNASTTR